MTYPQEPFGYGPFSYDPLGRVPFTYPPAEPPVLPPPPPPPRYRPPVNTLATLSVLFAFLFAPAGALLGHLGLAQIRRTGELGRDRALAGLTLSYVFITATVIAVVTWATLASSASRQAAAPATSTTTAPAGPTVAPSAAAGLLPGLDALKAITGDQNLQAGQTWDHPARSDREGTIDRPECWGSIAPGTPDAYDVDALFGYHAAEFSDTQSLLKSVQVIEAVAAFRDPAAAQSQLDRLVSGWRQCGGRTVNVTIPEAGTIPFSLSTPADAGNGITTMDLTPKGVQVRSARAIAAKANIVVDLYVSYSGSSDSGPRPPAVSIANYVLGKIPG